MRQRQGLVPDLLSTLPQGFETLMELKVIGAGSRTTRLETLEGAMQLWEEHEPSHKSISRRRDALTASIVGSTREIQGPLRRS